MCVSGDMDICTSRCMSNACTPDITTAAFPSGPDRSTPTELWWASLSGSYWGQQAKNGEMAPPLLSPGEPLASDDVISSIRFWRSSSPDTSDSIELSRSGVSLCANRAVM